MKLKNRIKRIKKTSGQTWCIVMMILILTISGLGYVASQMAGDAEAPQMQGIQAIARIDFGNYTSISELVNLTQGATAEDTLNKIAVINYQVNDIGLVEVTSVMAEEHSATKNDTHMWVFYVNGVLNFNEPRQHPVQHGQTIELRYEENPY